VTLSLVRHSVPVLMEEMVGAAADDVVGEAGDDLTPGQSLLQKP